MFLGGYVICLLDRDFKELTIRPALHLHVESSDFHVGFVNTGLGPAEIKAVALKFSPPQCLVLHNRPKRPDDDPEKSVSKIFADVLMPIEQYFADPLSQLAEPSSIWEPAHYPKLYARTLTPGQIIESQEEVVIFSLQKDQLEIAEKK
jgi:hypothetical protein